MDEEKILQISNDISEDMLSSRVSKAQLVQVINYWREKYHTAHLELKLEKIDKMIEYIEAVCK